MEAVVGEVVDDSGAVRELGAAEPATTDDVALVKARVEAVVVVEKYLEGGMYWPLEKPPFALYANFTSALKVCCCALTRLSVNIAAAIAAAKVAANPVDIVLLVLVADILITILIMALSYLTAL